MLEGTTVIDEPLSALKSIRGSAIQFDSSGHLNREQFSSVVPEPSLLQSMETLRWTEEPFAEQIIFAFASIEHLRGHDAFALAALDGCGGYGS